MICFFPTEELKVRINHFIAFPQEFKIDGTPKAGTGPACVMALQI
jgi:hypothetical protein